MKICFVSGVGKKSGIGYEIVRGLLKQENYKVIFNCRKEEVGKEILTSLQKEEELKGEPIMFLGDLSKEETIENLKKLINETFEGQLDVLVNNAGILGSVEGQSVLLATKEEMLNTFEVNTLIPLRLCQEFIPNMKKNNYGRIVNVSSGMGQLSEMGGKNAPYRFSKCSLNALTKVINGELESTENILINSCCPGFIKNEFSKYNVNATKTAQEGADSIVWLSTLDDNGPRGKFFRDRKELSF
jgi:NAD(P)-dependent dehydrogenase (short-subunit alcohol dehydrogenase family)